MARDKFFYLPELDGLRFFAFLGVFICHCGVSIIPMLPVAGAPLAQTILGMGSYGVDLFFTLSAYLITTLLSREIARTETIDIPAFYLRRVLRIWPLYFGFLGLVALSDAHVPRLFYISGALFVGNFYFAPFEPFTSAMILWSISVEEQFYLTWPLVMRFCGTRRHLIEAGIVLWASAIIGRAVLLHEGFAGLDLWLNSITHLDSIGAGVLLAAVRLERFEYKRGVMIALGAALWLAASSDSNSSVLSSALIAPGSGLMVLGAIGSSGLLRWRPIVYLGSISYGLYVFHNAIFRTSFQILGHASWALPPVALAVTIVVAAGSYRYFEAPFLRLKSRFQRVRSGSVAEQQAAA
jgi:peptidoglycan/LPS O-acetylase OafA/YrhL